MSVLLHHSYYFIIITITILLTLLGKDNSLVSIQLQNISSQMANFRVRNYSIQNNHIVICNYYQLFQIYNSSYQMASSQNIQKANRFLLKTYQMLQSGKHTNIIDWGPHGIGFVVHNPKQLAISVLKLYFKHSNFQSFVRQLNMYGFHKIRTQKTENYYSHELFSKGNMHLIKQITRKAQKKFNKKSNHIHSSTSIGNNVFSKSYRKKNMKNQQSSIHGSTDKLVSEIQNDQDFVEEDQKILPSEKNLKSLSQSKYLRQLFSLIQINVNLLQQQSYVFQKMKDQWNRQQKLIPNNLALIQLVKDNCSERQSTCLAKQCLKLMQTNQNFKEEKQMTLNAMAIYLCKNKQLLNSIYSEINQHIQSQTAQTKTTIQQI